MTVEKVGVKNEQEAEALAQVEWEFRKGRFPQDLKKAKAAKRALQGEDAEKGG